jgi:hypothetical protein
MTSLTTLDFLYLSLAAGSIILVIVIAVLAIHATLVLRDLRKISSVAGDVIEKFHGMVLKPINIVSRIADTVGPHIEEFTKDKMENFVSKKKRKKD